MIAFDRGRVFKCPVPSLGGTGKYRAFVLAAVAYGDHALVKLSGLEHFEKVLRLARRNIDTFFLHDLCHQGVDLVGRFETGAFDLEMLSGQFFQISSRDLTAAAIVLSNKQNSRFARH